MASMTSDKLLLHDTMKIITTENSTKKKYQQKINKMIMLIIVITNLFSIVTSTLVTFITTRQMYSESTRRPLQGAGVLGLDELQGQAIGLGELQTHEKLQGLHHHHHGVSG